MTEEESPNFVVIHVATGQHEFVQIVDDLKAYGLTVTRLDNPTSNAVSRLIGEYRVRIAVPEEQVAAAKTVIAGHIARGVSGSVPHIRALRRQGLATLAVFVVAGAVAYPFADDVGHAAWMAGLGAVGFFLLAGWVPGLKRFFEGE